MRASFFLIYLLKGFYMSLNMTIDEWKAGIPQRELERKIREYEENLPEREKMTAQARENNQTRFFLEDRFYELHKKELADMLKKQAEENRKFVGFTPHPTSPTLGEGLNSAYSGGGLGASALTVSSYGTAVSNGGQQVAGGYGNGYAADYAQTPPLQNNSDNNVSEEQAPMSFLEKAEALASAGMQGVSLGWADEIEGALGGLGYGFGAMLNLGPQKENVWDAVKRGYYKHRDARRDVLHRGAEEMPVAMTAAEIAGSVAAPNILRVGKGASSRVVDRVAQRNDWISAPVYGLGSAEGDWKSHAEGLGVGIGASLLTAPLSPYNNRFAMAASMSRPGRKVIQNTLNNMQGKLLEKGYNQGKEYIND
ncbi:MAG: hypothetical protein Q4F75_04285 [Pseudomonadota bacterium]|nr:hypothetical protein [Pseudomonadota bacterium]